MTEWTDEHIKVLRQLHADGLSFSLIAAALGCGFSRNAALGKAHRIGLPNRGKTPAITKPRKPRQSRTKQRLHIQPAGHGTLRVVTGPEAEEPYMGRDLPADAIPMRQRKQLFDLKPDDCRWPYGQPGKHDFFFCGGEALPDRSYCPFHMRIATGKSMTISHEEFARRQAMGRRAAYQNNVKRFAAGGE